MRRSVGPSTHRAFIARLPGLLLLLTATFAVSAQTLAPRCGTAVAIEAVLQRLNEVRAQGRRCGPEAAAPASTTLSWNESLANAARQQSDEMARLRHMSHRDGANRDLAERLRAQGYRFASAMENVAVGYGSVDAVVEAWLESAGHCRNLMNGAVLELGLACVDGAGPGSPEEQRYWTLVLAAPPPVTGAPRTLLDGRIAIRRDPPASP